MRACVILQAGLVNSDRHGINESATFSVLRKGLCLPGGQKSAFGLTQEIMQCDNKCG